ncbi:hypothetical protein [uncultured Chryseobacterium sp.]|uniref:hypothetical protein n=1 Tax=uncultured Chryseobacterium sp. TaxID=259322 RepID=UPI00258709E6|nr:hypothetical protein [uncultured Chryseobacterium sp.]
MIPIKHIINENGVKEIFKFIVPSGLFQGEYVINKPDGWDDVDSIVNIDDELLFVKDFIIGDNTKLKFYQYSNKVAYDILSNVNNEQGGDGRIIFKWLAVKNGIEYDLLKDNFEVNMNKFSRNLENNVFVIDVELNKSESQNKLSNRDEVNIDLFAEKSIDENTITPVQTFTIGYKKGDKILTNFYTYDPSQGIYGGHLLYPRHDHFFTFVRSSDYEFGTNNNEMSGYKNNQNLRSELGPFIETNITLKGLKVEISNMHLVAKRTDGNYPNVGLYLQYRNGGSVIKNILLKNSVNTAFSGESEIKIDNQIINLEDSLQPGQNIFITVITNENVDFTLFSMKETASIKFTTNMESPLVKTRGIRLIDAINQIVKSYSDSALSVVSNYIGSGGVYYNSSISTGIYLRGLPSYLTVGQKIKTSLSTLFFNGVVKLFAMGYDILNQNVIVEDLAYFFKDIKVYDFSGKIYLQEGFKMQNDKDVTFNTLSFGSKKYSTNIKDDIQNFITTAEFTTPIKTIKNKFDKQTELIIDEYKIQELIEDKSSATNDNDDDIVLIDMVNKTSFYDSGIFDNCIHSNVDNKLVLTCSAIPFDTTIITPGMSIEIVEGINTGIYTVLNLSENKLTLDKTSGIAEGMFDTPIRYFIEEMIKNRSIQDGFTNASNIRNPETSTNSRHNPKYHMARWFKWFGSGLRKKQNSELIKVTKYKNNDEAQMEINGTDLANELPDLIRVGADENLGRLRKYNTPLFSGEIIEISYNNVTFQEFIECYENWRYGIAGERLNSRGYITLNTPMGLYDVYPLGDGAFSHDRKNNILNIKGKIKGRSAASPVLLSVVQENKNTVTLNWEYGPEYISPLIDVQYSADGITWITVRQFYNVKQGTIIDDVFLDIITGTNVYFRVNANTSDFVNKISNTIMVDWKFNPYTIIARNKSENTDCGYSRIVFDLKGKADFEIEYSYQFMPSGGKLWATNLNGTGGNLVVETDYGLTEIDGVETRNISIDGDPIKLYIDLFNSDKTETQLPLNCVVGDYQYTCYANVIIKFTDTITSTSQSFGLVAETPKKYS